MKVEKTSNINIKIGLNEQQVPVKINWEADGNPDGSAKHESKAMLLALFDKETKDTMKIDLWTTEMQVVEMDRFFFQTLRSMADTYFKSTQNAELVTAMQQFVQFFGEKTQILPPSK